MRGIIYTLIIRYVAEGSFKTFGGACISEIQAEKKKKSSLQLITVKMDLEEKLLIF